jgi:uncharacterized protein YndB with AHSA1/START domain
MRTIELTVEIQAPAAQVWRALTTPEEIARWFAPIVTGSTALGEQTTFSWGYAGGEYTDIVSARDEGRHLRWGDDSLVTDWFIEARAGGVTVLRLVHSGWGDGAEWDEQYDATAGGWRYFLFNLRQYVEHHAGEPRTAIIDRRPMRLPRTGVFDRVRAALPDGFRVVATEAPHRVWGVLPAYGDAVVLIEMEPGPDSYHCGIYLSLYGDAARHADAARASTARMLDAASTAPAIVT